MMPMRKFQAGEPMALICPLHGICRGLPAVEISDQRDVLRVGRMAEEINMMQGAPAGTKPCGTIKEWFGNCSVHFVYWDRDVESVYCFPLFSTSFGQVASALARLPF